MSLVETWIMLRNAEEALSPISCSSNEKVSASRWRCASASTISL